ncbi:molybdenum cofactor biosynthesis protein MoaE [Helicobacter anatolicus]|uniref:molybdenum cofactor biosynthesis protein MoaE n=1 Tax=Helicobacter anatolicus TaxID=2905874 RepID=UPI001E505095|nr:molybdenum cofactor biosynthesis protein MoaE [Helicobacter anatolicus]MCE3039050.1 molybdenum cofactor biosynthesis protein MoaE [Helicobacter anatolicus]MCE3040415.1 molybdenum cofactor biosynthesis protein MoaE [Helicobacter anatolicus]
MLEIFKGALPTLEIYEKYEKLAQEKNCGACCVFCGVVRKENDISGLSFDIYEPLLKKWFINWSKKLEQEKIFLAMAHSVGDVLVLQSSFMCALISPQRKAALKYYDEFVEDFKHHAPIWKYDLKNSERIYAKERSFLLPESGLFAK